MLKKNADSRIDQRIDLVCSHITYEIATGVFQQEAKLPTVREAVERWNVDHRIVLKAYKRLEKLGLVKCIPRSGYFVSLGESHDLVTRHRFELEAMFDRLSKEISKTTNLSVLGAFRYFAQLAEIRARINPECVFVECTQIQAAGHAAEVTGYLSIPCMPMTIDQIAGKSNRIPGHVRTVLVTGFHYGELRELVDSRNLNVLSVPIEVTKELIQPVSKREQTIIFESDESQAEHMVQDIEKIQDSRVCRLEVTSDINESLAKTYGENGKKRTKVKAFLSPRLWGRVDSHWREHPNIHLIEFRIVESAWPSIADAIGLPLGAVQAR